MTNAQLTVIPAKAGTQGALDSRLRDACAGMTKTAFAGMTKFRLSLPASSGGAQ
jgi:hypothetical protein